ncbi:MAG: site-specific DNA-methyltransferase [Ruminococcaceae bacterium]|nr:site-specific DNA-methyltransferase [Oscillospiraceae bacterium]MBR3596693.1 site-specific DNA-methyltransferase [Clostridia bacterium]
MSSERNKTINTDISEGKKYLDLCLFTKKNMTSQDMADRYFNADFFTAVKYMPDKCVDLVIADPPYNLRKDYGGEVFSRKKSDEYAEFTRSWLREIKRLLKDTGSIYVCCDWQTSLIIGCILPEFFKIRNRITWQREKGRGAKKNWKNGMEDIWYCTVSDEYTFNLNAVKIKKKVIAPYRENGKPKDWQESEKGNFRMTCPSNFWDDITVPFWSMKENTAHPTQKPEKLTAKMILASSDKGDLVFDPFAGSGTTAVTAKKLGRHFTATEKNPRYCVWSQIRLENADEDKTIQGFDGKVFYERNNKS